TTARTPHLRLVGDKDSEGESRKKSEEIESD
ncbi:uncharacterized protein METZ01_LOCUS214524, partial [marine metagenome]